MASIPVAAIGLTGPWGFVAALGASIIDSQFLLPALAGNGRQNARPPRLVGIPTGSNEPGAPRIWACGNRVRVPCHVLWQSTKTRETTANQKGSTGIVQRRAFVDAAISINDRETSEMRQLIGNGKLLVWKSRNLTNVLVVEPRYADPLSLVFYKKVLVTKAAMEQLKEMLT